LQGMHQFGEAFLGGLDGEARSDGFAIGAEHANSVGMQGDIYADTI
jgi:hypothetical protein